MTRKTSIEAYNTIKENGLLSRRRFQFYHTVVFHGPITANQAARLVEETFKVRMSNSGIGSRLSELRNLGVIDIVGERKDEHTGMSNYLWESTDMIPIKLIKPKRIHCKHCEGTGYENLSLE